MLAQWPGCGLGRLPAARRAERAREDVHALARLLADNGPGRCGDCPYHADLALAATSAHLLEAPFDSAAADEARGHARLAQHREWVRSLMN